MTLSLFGTVVGLELHKIEQRYPHRHHDDSPYAAEVGLGLLTLLRGDAALIFPPTSLPLTVKRICDGLFDRGKE